MIVAWEFVEVYSRDGLWQVEVHTPFFVALALLLPWACAAFFGRGR